MININNNKENGKGNRFMKDFTELNGKGLSNNEIKLYNALRNLLQLSKGNSKYTDKNGVPFVRYPESKCVELNMSVSTFKRAKRKLKTVGLISYNKQTVKVAGCASNIYVNENLGSIAQLKNEPIKNEPMTKNPVDEIKKVETKKIVKKATTNDVVDNKSIEMLLNEIREIKKQNEELNNKVDELTKKVDELSNNQKSSESIVANEEVTNIETSTEQKESTTNEANANKIENNIVEPTPFFKGKLGFNNNIDRLLEEWQGDPIKIKEFEAKEPKKKRTRKVKPKLSFEDTRKLNEGKPFMYEGKWYRSDGELYVYDNQVITRKINI
jgi:hypothetical protein